MRSPHRLLTLLAVASLPWVMACGPAGDYASTTIVGSQATWSPDGAGHVHLEGRVDLEFNILGSDGEEAEVRLLSVSLTQNGRVTEMDEGHSDPPTPFTHVVGQPSALSVYFAGSVDTSAELCFVQIQVALWDSYTDELSAPFARLADGPISPPCNR